ncbi:MAG: type II toxin-antitoxin system HicB family antitoxin [Patescibacteria group bacterium]
MDRIIALVFTLVKDKGFWYDTFMEKKILNYRVVITPDERTGRGKPCYTAYVPLLGIATDGDTIEEALMNVQDAILVYVRSLREDGQEIPLESINGEFITTASVELS